MDQVSNEIRTEREENMQKTCDSENVENDKCNEENNDNNKMLYTINENPPIYLSLLLGFQHYLTMFGGAVSTPLAIAPFMCFGDDYVSKSEVIGTLFFVSGIITFLQSTFGVRLPIVQGGTFGFLTPTIAILSLEKWKCPAVQEISLNTTTTTTTTVDQREIWQPRMREIQGAIIVSSLFQVFIGFSGLIGLLLRFIGPITIAVTISLVGLPLYEVGSMDSSKHWWIAIMTIILITLFSQYLRNVGLPMLTYNKKERKIRIKRYPVFKVFPVIIAIAVSWFICFILTITDTLPDNREKWGYEGRTDTKLNVLTDSKWFRFPYPGQWGRPTVSTAAVFGMLSGVLASMVESIGDYYAAARLSGAPPPPVHALNRGIFMEGLGCVLAGIWGSGSGTTSYSENVGALGITKVGSRRVIQAGALLMLVFGMFGKFGAFFVTIPDPIIGGIFLVMFGTVFAVGVSNLQYVDLNSGRNIYIYGFSVIFGLALPKWMEANHGVISTGSDTFDQILTVLCSTSMFIGGSIAAILDNTIPGTDAERGLLTWRKQKGMILTGQPSMSDTYDFPIGMKLIRKISIFRFVPICPTFKGFWGNHDFGNKRDVNAKPISNSDKAKDIINTPC